MSWVRKSRLTSLGAALYVPRMTSPRWLVVSIPSTLGWTTHTISSLLPPHLAPPLPLPPLGKIRRSTSLLAERATYLVREGENENKQRDGDEGIYTALTGVATGSFLENDMFLSSIFGPYFIFSLVFSIYFYTLISIYPFPLQCKVQIIMSLILVAILQQ